MPVLVRRVILRNYKSIGQCKVDLGPLTLLVGPNGSGKSNFVDAIRFASESVKENLEWAIRQRGGIDLIRRFADQAEDIFIGLHLTLNDGAEAEYEFKIAAKGWGEYAVKEEKAHIFNVDGDIAKFSRVIRDGHESVLSNFSDGGPLPSISADRLLLPALSGFHDIRPLYDALTSMGFYSISPSAISSIQTPGNDEILAPDGMNIANILRHLEHSNEQALSRISEYIAAIIPAIRSIFTTSAMSQYIFLNIMYTTRHGRNTPVPAHIMSAGTLRSLGILTALFQFLDDKGTNPHLIAIEEPESTIHPAAARVLMDAMIEASQQQQVIATTHSPDLLDHPAVQDKIVAVASVDGETRIAPVDEGALQTIKDGLCTAGELLRQNQLEPDPKHATDQVGETEMFPDQEPGSDESRDA